MEGIVSGVNHYRKWSSVTQRPVSTADLCHAFLPEWRGSDKMSERQGCVCAHVQQLKMILLPLKVQFIWRFLAIQRVSREIDANYLEDRQFDSVNSLGGVE